MTGLIDFDTSKLHIVTVGGRRTVTQPLVVGRLTAQGAARFEDQIKKPAQSLYPDFIPPLQQFEERYFGRLELADFRDLEIAPQHAPGKGRPTTGWHTDNSRLQNVQHTYIIGSREPRFNTEYVTDTWHLPKWVRKRLRENNCGYETADQQIDLTEYLRKAGTTRHIGEYEVLLMPCATLHRTSPHHPERAEPWPFLRYSVVRGFSVL